MSSSSITGESSKAFVDRAMKRVSRQRIVLDLGGGSRFDKWLREYEPLFAAADYRTMDYDASTRPDVVGDIHAIPLGDASVDAVICSSVLEHVRDPEGAMKEIRRILAPGGVLFLYVPSIYPYHPRKGAYPDNWRFFEDTVRMLLDGFESIEIEKRGGYFLALSFFVPFGSKFRRFLTWIAGGLDGLFGTKRKTTTAGYYALAVRSSASD